MAKVGSILDFDGNTEFILQMNESELRLIQEIIANSNAGDKNEPEEMLEVLMLHGLLEGFVKYLDNE